MATPRCQEVVALLDKAQKHKSDGEAMTRWQRVSEQGPDGGGAAGGRGRAARVPGQPAAGGHRIPMGSVPSSTAPPRGAAPSQP